MSAPDLYKIMLRVKSTPSKSRKYLNRELSWLEFNQRVLAEAQNSQNPLLERLKFFCIVSSNLDEFFEVRVAGIKQQIESRSDVQSHDGRTPLEIFDLIHRRVRKMVQSQYRCWNQELRLALQRAGIRFWRPAELPAADQAWAAEYFQREIEPVLTPLAIDPSHPFPQLLNKSLNLIVRLTRDDDRQARLRLAVVQVPRGLPRLILLPRGEGQRDYLLLGALIGAQLQRLFPGTTVHGCWAFRLTRNSELYIDEEEIANLLSAVEKELQRRRRGAAVRLEVEKPCPPDVQTELLRLLQLKAHDLYVVDGPLNPVRFLSIVDGDHSPALRYPEFVAPPAGAFRDQPDIFETIQRRDILLHHPYESFETVVDFLQKAARDPDVLAIKQTLYRTGGDSRIIGALMEAGRNGKQVAAVVELRARFDEANNIHWARQLEEAGVHVVYGLVGYKIHAKATLVIRREGLHIRRYVHLGTGNYNPNTARLYTDVSLLTSHPEIGEDVTNLFNLLTGICQFQPMKRLLVAPFDLHPRLIQLIRREAQHARRGVPARVVAKMNSLVDPVIIQELYAASQAGVQIDLIVRGICCLRPGVKGLSENIRVRSIVDRFLEHSRIYWFENACQPEAYLGSPDWMPRNFFRRIETVFPILDGVLRERVYQELLAVPLRDNMRASALDSAGRYSPVTLVKDATPCRSQFHFIAQAQQAARVFGGDLLDAKFPLVKLAPRPA